MHKWIALKGSKIRSHCIGTKGTVGTVMSDYIPCYDEAYPICVVVQWDDFEEGSNLCGLELLPVTDIRCFYPINKDLVKGG